MDGDDRSRQLEADFRSFLRGRAVASLSPDDALEAMSRFFATVKYPLDGSSPHDDMLLFQYGVYDWGQGENFEFDITRQVVFEHGDDEDADDHIIQLSLTFRYDPGPFRALPAVTQWSSELPAPGDLTSFARDSKAYALLKGLTPREIALHASAQ